MSAPMGWGSLAKVANFLVKSQFIKSTTINLTGPMGTVEISISNKIVSLLHKGVKHKYMSG